MAHPNRLFNGDFAGDLSNWAVGGNAVFIVSQGNKELGAVHLPDAGSYVEQSFTIGVGRPYMVEVAVKGASGTGTVALTITNSSGTVFSSSLAFGNGWVNRAERVGLPWGDYTLRLAFSSGAVYVDDVSVAHVVKTRAELAASVAGRLGILATQASMTAVPNGTATEGDYTDPVNEGLRAVGACDPAGREDVRFLEGDALSGCLEEIELAMLQKLQRYWTTKTDYAIGPRQEHLNQISAALLALTGGAVGGRPASAGRSVKVRKLEHRNAL